MAYVFQIAAFDHWAFDPSHDVLGLEGSDAHAAHCHGSVSDCADSGTASVVLNEAEIVRLPAPPAAYSRGVVSPEATPADVFVPSPFDPPQAA